MFDKVRVTDWDSLIYSAIISFPTFMFSMPIAMLMWYQIKSVRNGENIFKGLHQGDYIVIIVVSLLFLVCIYGMLRAWHWPAFLSVEDNGTWRFRNSFGYTLLQLPPNKPRRIEGIFSLVINRGANEVFFTGNILVLCEDAPPIFMRHTAHPLEDGEPDFYQKFGYPKNLVLMDGSNGGKVTPWHGWNSNGFVFLLDKNHGESNISSPND